MKMIAFSANCWISILLFVTVRGTPVPVSSLEEQCEDNNCTILVKEDLEPCIVPEEVNSEEEILTISTDTEVEPVNEITLIPELMVEGADNNDLVPDDDIVTANIIPLTDTTEDLREVEEEAVPCSDFEEDCNEDNPDVQLISVTIPEESLADTILIDQAVDADPEPSQNS